jgi:hypothetical protein
MAAKMDVSVVLRLVDQLVGPMKATTAAMKEFNKVAKEAGKSGAFKTMNDEMRKTRESVRGVQKNVKDLGEESDRTGKKMSEHAKAATKHMFELGKSIHDITGNWNAAGGALTRVGGKTGEVGKNFMDLYWKATMLTAAVAAVGPAAKVAASQVKAWHEAGASVDGVRKAARAARDEFSAWRDAGYAMSHLKMKASEAGEAIRGINHAEFGASIAAQARRGGDAITHHLVGGLTKFAASYAATSAAFGAANIGGRVLHRAAGQLGLEGFVGAGIRESGARQQESLHISYTGITPDEVNAISADKHLHTDLKSLTKGINVETDQNGVQHFEKTPHAAVDALNRLVFKQAAAFAEASGTLTQSESMHIFKELRGATGSWHEVIEVAPELAPLQKVMATLGGSKEWQKAYGPDGGSHAFFDIIKTAEFRNALWTESKIAEERKKGTSEEELERHSLKYMATNMMQQVVASGGQLTFQDFHMVAKNLKENLQTLDNDFMFGGEMGALMQEFKVGKHGSAQGFGTAATSFLSAIGGRFDKRTIPLLQEYGFIKEDEGQGAAWSMFNTAAKSPVQAVHEDILPPMFKKLFNKDYKIGDEISSDEMVELIKEGKKLFMNRNASGMFSMILSGGRRLLKEVGVRRNVKTLDEMNADADKSPQLVMKQFATAWSDATAVIMQPYQKFIYTPLIRRVTSGFDLSGLPKPLQMVLGGVPGLSHITGGMRGWSAAHKTDNWMAYLQDITLAVVALTAIWKFATRLKPVALMMAGISLGTSFGGIPGAIMGGVAAYGLTRMVAGAAASGGLGLLAGGALAKAFPRIAKAGGALGLGRVLPFLRPNQGGIGTTLGFGALSFALTSAAGLNSGPMGFAVGVAGLIASFFPWLRLIYIGVLAIMSIFKNWQSIKDALANPSTIIPKIWSVIKGSLGYGDDKDPHAKEIADAKKDDSIVGKVVDFRDPKTGNVPLGPVTYNTVVHVNGAGDPAAVGKSVVDHIQMGNPMGDIPY